jgi:predicted negative regulator of RcsB-dependent stress response
VAGKHLRQVLDTSSDKELASIARLRLARLLIQTGKHDEALQLLDIEKAGVFAAPMREIRGDAMVAKGDAQGARAEYAAALAEESKGQLDRATVELKLRDVGGEVRAEPAKTVAPAKTAAPAAQGDS